MVGLSVVHWADATAETKAEWRERQRAASSDMNLVVWTAEPMAFHLAGMTAQLTAAWTAEKMVSMTAGWRAAHLAAPSVERRGAWKADKLAEMMAATMDDC